MSRPPRTAARRDEEVRRDDEGAVSAELVVAVPVLLLLLLAAVQAGVWWHANHVAQTVAAHVLATARAQDGTAVTGRATGDRVLGQLGTAVLLDTRIEVTRTPAVTRVEIRAQAEPVIPGLALPVVATAAGTTEPPP